MREEEAIMKQVADYKQTPAVQQNPQLLKFIDTAAGAKSQEELATGAITMAGGVLADTLEAKPAKFSQLQSKLQSRALAVLLRLNINTLPMDLVKTVATTIIEDEDVKEACLVIKDAALNLARELRKAAKEMTPQKFMGHISTFFRKIGTSITTKCSKVFEPIAKKFIDFGRQVNAIATSLGRSVGLRPR